jgi:hypothetical protein
MLSFSNIQPDRKTQGQALISFLLLKLEESLPKSRDRDAQLAAVMMQW